VDAHRSVRVGAGQLIAGVALILAPPVWLVAVLIRYLVRRIADFTPQQEAYFGGQTYRAPQQLAVYLQEPQLTTAGYALFAGASVLLLPAVFGLARSAVVGRGWLASIGGLLVAVSLMARLYFSGVDLTAFELVDQLGLEVATRFVLDGYVDLSYGLWRIPVSLSAGSILGCLVLAIAAYRAGVFGLGRCLLLVWWGWTFMGVLKDSHLGTVLGGVALCLTMIPLGVGVLGGGNAQPALRVPAGQRSIPLW
jgi:hypothetical protein